MDFLADFLGVSIGNMIGNPATIVAGLIVSRLTPKAGRFWFELAVAVLACLGVQFGLERMEGLGSAFSTTFWLAAETISIAVWTLLFSIGRKLRSRRYTQRDAERDRQDNEPAQD